jgi:hypothetical protein
MDDFAAVPGWLPPGQDAYQLPSQQPGWAEIFGNASAFVSVLARQEARSGRRLTTVPRAGR